MRNSAGQRIENELAAVRRSLYTFEFNYRDLLSTLDALESAANLDIWHLQNRDALHMAQHEVARLLHNLVAAAQSLVDHTRNISRRLLRDHDDAQKSYQDRVDSDFAEDPLSRFVLGLRQYCLHKELPFMGFRFSFNQTEANQEFFLNKEQLADFDWSSQARAFLDEPPDEISLRDVLGDYRDKVLAFHRWFDEHVRDVHSRALKELDDLEREYALLELEASMGMFAAEPSGDPATRVSNVFVQVLQPDELRGLSEIADARDRLEAAVALAERSLSLPGSLKERLLALVPPKDPT